MIKAAALALRDFPRANGAYRDGQFELYSRVNVGVAVAGQDALVVPTVFDADKKSLGTIAAEARGPGRARARGQDHAARALGRHVHDLQPRHVRHPPLHGGDQPAAGRDPGRRRAPPRPVVRDGEVVVRAMMELTLTCDHRILYGADAAEFLGQDPRVPRDAASG